MYFNEIVTPVLVLKYVQDVPIMYDWSGLEPFDSCRCSPNCPVEMMIIKTQEPAVLLIWI